MQKFVDFLCHIVFLFLISSIYWNSSWIWFRELRRESEKIMPVYNGPSTDGSLSVCELTVSLWKFMLMLYFHVALFLCWTISMLHFLCSNLFMLLIYVSLFFLLHCMFHCCTFVLRSFCVLHYFMPQPAFTCSKLTIETVEKGVKYDQN